MFCPLKKPWSLRLSTLLGGQAVQAEVIALVYHQPRLQLQLVAVLLRPSAGIIDLTERMPCTAINLAPGRETSWPAGGILLSSCRQIQKLQSDLSTGFFEQTQVFIRLQCFSVRFSLFETFRQQLRF